jgi:carboxyl-terminal processing protease
LLNRTAGWSLLLFWVAGCLAGAEPSRSVTAVTALQDLILFTQKYNHIEPLPPGQYDCNIARLVSLLLQQLHYSHHPVDDEVSARFLHRYLEILDGMHFHFVQADIQEFNRYGTTLDDMTLKQGDTSPAPKIFARFLQRVEQRTEYAAQLLQQEQFEFTGEDRYTPSRKKAEWPADMTAAKQLWRQHLRYEYLQEKLSGKKHDEIIKVLSNRYRRVLRTLVELDSDEVLQLYLTALSQAYDPHSDYMGKPQLENFAISMKLSLFGIGALLTSEDGYCKIHELVSGGPAAKSKRLKPNDKITFVQQEGQEPVDVVDMKLSKVVDMIRGPKGTKVTLTIVPADAPDPSMTKTVTLVRDEIKLEDQEAKAKLVELPDADGRMVRVAVLDLPSFYASFDLASARGKSGPKSTTEDVARLLKKLTEENVAGVILDLRRNGGGSLEEAVKLTGAFIKEGPVVQVKDSDGQLTVESDEKPEVLYDGPLVVLTSRLSASASEILAAALQDYGRALIVGDASTHGKGTVQTIYELGKFRLRQPFPPTFNPGALKVTIRKFYRVTGSSTQQRGVAPDLVLPSLTAQMEIGESTQEYALPWDTIPQVKFDQLNRIRPHVEELRKRSQARQERDIEFAYLKEDIERYRKSQADKSISLNEALRLKEKSETDARAKARKQERAVRVDPKPKTYEITLKQADLPGLPDPVVFTNAPPPTVREQADPAAGEPEAEPEDKTLPVDVTLEEAKRILLDLITLLPANGKATPAISAN